MTRFLLLLGACVAVAAAQTPTNDVCAAATPLNVGLNTGTTAGASPSTLPASAECAAIGRGDADVWFAYVAAADETVTLTLSGPGADRVAVYLGGCADPGAPILCEGGPGGVFPIGMAETALVRVGAPFGVVGAFTLNVSVGPPQQAASLAASSSAGPPPVVGGAAATPALRASTEILGTGCGGSGGVEPTLTATLPQLAHPLLLQLGSAEPLSPALLLADFGRSAPFAVPFLPSGCVAYVDPIHAVVLANPTTDATGAATHVATLPGDPSLLGVELTLQAVIAPADAVPTLQLTNGLRLILGR